jgi:hypothetical protein
MSRPATMNPLTPQSPAAARYSPEVETLMPTSRCA